MDTTRWALLGITAAVTGTLVVISLSSSPQSRLFRWTRRIFWAGALLLVSGEIGGVGLNLFNLAAVAGLGMPGYMAAMALHFL